MLDAPTLRTPDHSALIAALATRLPPERLITDPLRRLAYGTDAGFYRLIPALVVRVESEEEVRRLLKLCHRHAAPVTFRAAGTSLSGQSITDSVLMLLGDSWNRIDVQDGGLTIRLQPGVIGAHANARLAAFSRKIGPDPASIDSAKIGGIAANNSSGMCCGTSDNSYKTLVSMRLILADGTLVDTGNPASVAAFRASHERLLLSLAAMARSVAADTTLAERIRRKFAIKNTTGYSLNALVDFEDPLDILQHLMIGSEGTLGFIADITYRTVPDHAAKASALLLFDGIEQACRAVAALKSTPVSAVELMDRAALRAVEGKPGMPGSIAGLGPDAAALLVEVRGADEAECAANVAIVGAALDGVEVAFSTDPGECARLWKIRKGLFPAVGAVRPLGTTVIIEDVAFRLPDLAAATLDLQALFAKHGYSEAIIFGHALDGNLHFVFTQDFGSAAEVDRYSHFMEDVCHLVVEKYDGSLKAEHGTGRNMAPFVEMEWGREATALMWKIKHLLDPRALLNPGVVLNDNPHVHLENLKALPAADPLVDSCIECGFCERMCPSHGLTLSPRQRIVGWREISRAEADGDDAKELRKLYDYHGVDTCAACGLCATACPVGIETGALIKSLRGRKAGPVAHMVAQVTARNFGGILAMTRLGLNAAAALPVLRRTKAGRMLPTAASLPPDSMVAVGIPMVYVPSCASRTMGASVGDPETASLPERTAALFAKAGFAVTYPKGLSNLCCGQPYDSKGMKDIADAKAGEMERALFAASDGGRLPIVMDTSTCTARLRDFLAERLEVVDIVSFLHDRVLPRLAITPLPGPVLVHLNCAIRKMGLEGTFLAVARACAEQVVVPDGITCCGFAGDKGFTTPELNAHALRLLPQAVPAGCEEAFSSNRTCEIGLSEKAGIPYRSIVYLVDRVSQPK